MLLFDLEHGHNHDIHHDLDHHDPDNDDLHDLDEHHLRFLIVAFEVKSEENYLQLVDNHRINIPSHSPPNAMQRIQHQLQNDH